MLLYSRIDIGGLLLRANTELHNKMSVILKYEQNSLMKGSQLVW